MTMTSIADDTIDYSDIEAKWVKFLYHSRLFSQFSLRYQVHYDDSFDKTLVVDGVPVIDRSKLERLLTKVTKEFSRKGVSIKPDDIFMPWDNTSSKSKGWILYLWFGLRVSTFCLVSCLLTSRMLMMPILHWPQSMVILSTRNIPSKWIGSAISRNMQIWMKPMWSLRSRNTPQEYSFRSYFIASILIFAVATRSICEPGLPIHRVVINTWRIAETKCWSIGTASLHNAK